MKIQKITFNKILFIVPLLCFLSGCMSLMPKPYQAPQRASTAQLTYDIDPSTFFSPESWINSGYIERVDIQLRTSRLSHPKTIYMQFSDKIGSRNIHTIEANKPLRLHFEHKMVQGLGYWPMMCATNPIQVTFEPNHHYVFKAGTSVNYRPSKLFKNIETFDASCQVQIIDMQTKQVIASTIRHNFK